MIAVDHTQAILFRLLADIFGKDKVIPQMSVTAVCGGELPANLATRLSQEIQKEFNQSINDWAKRSKCLFTVINNNDDPRMVVDLAGPFSDVVDIQDLTRKRFLKPVLDAAGVNYVAITFNELEEILDPTSNFTMFKLLQERFGLADSTDS